MNKPFEKIRKKENIIYLILWVIAIIFYLLHVMGEGEPNGVPSFSTHDFIRMCVTILPLLFLFLINNFLLIPKLLMRRHTRQYLTAVAFALGIVIAWQIVMFRHDVAMHMFENFADAGHPMHRHPRPRHLLPMPLINDIVYALMVVGINLAIAFLSRQMVFNLEREKLSAVHMETRLAQLKEQINPHFYMNMLNNIHGLIEIDPEKAQDMVFDMSQLMRYMLYDSAASSISLSAELKFLRDYIRVVSQRYPDDKVKITTDFPADQSIRHVHVPPLVFLVFIENSFKYGVSYRRQSFISISLTVSDDFINFHCINSRHEDMRHPDEPHGIGLNNITQRLQLIYGDDMLLDVDDQNPDTFSVSLKIPAYETAHTPD